MLHLVIAQADRTGPNLRMNHDGLRVVSVPGDEFISYCENNPCDAVIWWLEKYELNWWAACAKASQNQRGVPFFLLLGGEQIPQIDDLISAGIQEVGFYDEVSPLWLLQRIKLLLARSRRLVAHGTHNCSNQHALEPTNLSGHSRSVARVRRSLTTTKATARVLVVDRDGRTRNWLQKTLEQRCYGTLTVCAETASGVLRARERLLRERFDCVISDSFCAENGLRSLVDDIRRSPYDPPLIALVPETVDERVSLIREGADDIWSLSQLFPRTTQTSFLLNTAWAIYRQTSRQKDQFVPHNITAGENATSEDEVESEYRYDERYILTKSLSIIPVRPDLTPDPALLSDGFTCDIGVSGLSFEIAKELSLPTRNVVVGIETGDGRYQFATLVVRNCRTLNGRMRIGGEFANEENELFSRANLIPKLDSKHWRFKTAVPEESLVRWGQLGVVQPFVYDRVLTCPVCHAMASFRDACRSCGSIAVRSRPMIHHFACAHVDHVETFESGDSLTCPKCRAHSLVSGADFEYLNGPFECADCNWSDTELEVMGKCLRCENQFPLHESIEEDIIGYRTSRLEPLALVGSP